MRMKKRALFALAAVLFVHEMIRTRRQRGVSPITCALLSLLLLVIAAPRRSEFA